MAPSDDLAERKTRDQQATVIHRQARIWRTIRGLGLVALVVISLSTAGCVQRRMTIRSNPPGAFVYVDNYPIGTTPVSTDFTYYGKRQFRLVRDGYETLTVDQNIKAPWYEWIGLDFVSENLVPYDIRDERTLNFQLAPQQVPPAPVLTARAEELRASSQAQRYVPPVQVPPGTPPPVPQGPPASRIPPPGSAQPQFVLPPPAVGGQPPPPVYQPMPSGPPALIQPPPGQYQVPPAASPMPAPGP